MIVASVDWTQVLVALIAGVPATVAAWAGLHNKAALKTPSGTSIGKQVESTHHTALGNNYRLQALGNGFDVPMPDDAAREEAHVEELNTVRTNVERKAQGD